MDLTSINLDTIIQGGAVGISVLLIIALVIIIKAVFKMMGNHVNHNTAALNKVALAVDGIKGAVNNNTKQTERLEKVIDTKLQK
ncbi:MAG: hypothetical protein KAU20_06010 [Nanoarchaeota archaeon]|nr:hypothetical protein [Nanoarchaeota archaeon]